MRGMCSAVSFIKETSGKLPDANARVFLVMRVYLAYGITLILMDFTFGILKLTKRL